MYNGKSENNARAILMKIKGVIFDLDGTVLDTEVYQYLGWVEPLKELGIKFTEEEYIKYVGKPSPVIDPLLIRNYNLKIKEGSLLAKKMALLEKWFRTRELEFMPYAREAIDFFHRNGIKLAIASGGSREETTMKLRKKGILSMFDFISSGSDDVKRGKPEPDIYIHSLKGLGLEKGEVIVFEDTRDGMMSAKSAGIKCFVIPNRFTRNQDFSEADRVFPSLKEAVDFVRERPD
jgi:HAD superfamily hydrolase (TIGR01509 family)